MPRPRPAPRGAPVAQDTPRCETCGRPTSFCVCDRVEPHKIGVRVLVLRHPQEADADLGTAGLLSQLLPEDVVVRTGLSWRSLAHALESEEAVQPREWAVLWSGARDSEAVAPAGPVRGLIALDGTWSQAKTLWWRNAWLLKCPRLALEPAEPSIYGRLRKEPHRDCVSTLEAVALGLTAVGEDRAVSDALRRTFRVMCQRARDAAAPPKTPPATA